MNANSRVALFLTIAFTSGCSSSSVKERVLRNAALAGAVGYAAGSQRDRNQQAFGALYGGVAAALVAVGSVYYYDPDAQLAEYRQRTDQLKEELDQFSAGGSVSRRRTPVASGAAVNSLQALPAKYRNLIAPGEWVLSEIDEWEAIDDTRLIHKTEMIELKPPTLRSINRR